MRPNGFRPQGPPSNLGFGGPPNNPGYGGPPNNPGFGGPPNNPGFGGPHRPLMGPPVGPGMGPDEFEHHEEFHHPVLTPDDVIGWIDQQVSPISYPNRHLGQRLDQCRSS